LQFNIGFDLLLDILVIHYIDIYAWINCLIQLLVVNSKHAKISSLFCIYDKNMMD